MFELKNNRLGRGWKKREAKRANQIEREPGYRESFGRHPKQL